MPFTNIEVAIFKMNVACGCAHSVTVVEAVMTMSETVVVTGCFVMVALIVTVDAETLTVETVVTVVVEGVIERQEQADEIFEGGDVVK